MNTPHSLKTIDRSGAVVRTIEYDDGTVIAIDFGHTGNDLGVDIVGDTAIVVTDDDQFEFELPPEATDVSARNGILLIEE